MGADSDRDVDRDVGLPEHERDEYRRRAEDQQPEPDPLGLARPPDQEGLPEHERDPQQGEDTGTPSQNP